MLQAERSRVILQKVTETEWLQSASTNDRPNKGIVYDGEWYNKGTLVYYIPHTALVIDTPDGEFMAVPKDQIVAQFIINKPTWAK